MKNTSGLYGWRACAPRTLGIALVALATAGESMAQGDDPLWDTDPCGLMSMRDNWNATQGYNFAIAGVAIRMADPTIVKITDNAGTLWFYVTGTWDGVNASDARARRNFPIYRSKDLRTWQFVRMAFPESYDANWNLQLNGRKFRNLWSPQLYVDPAEESWGNSRNIYLTFAATEVLAGVNYDPSDNQTIIGATISKEKLLGTGYFASNADGRGHEPIWYYYEVDDTGAVKFDGGYAQGQEEGTPRTIPVTVAPNIEGQACNSTYGSTYRYPYGWGHGCVGANTAMADAPYVYFDHSSLGGQRWMIYNWNVIEGITSNGGPFDGNHVAAYPMRTNFIFKAAPSQAQPHIPLAYRYNENNKPDGVLKNGAVDLLGQQWMPDYRGPEWPAYTDVLPAYVAEGGAAFRNNATSRTYFLTSRNTWDSPAYQVVYRFGPGGLYDRRMTDASGNNKWDHTTIGEYVLVASNWVQTHSGGRDTSRTNSFGHGEVFWAWGRAYLIFHAKLDFSGERRIYFKELSFNSDGTIKRLYDGHPAVEQNLNKFLAPTCPYDTPPAN